MVFISNRDLCFEILLLFHPFFETQIFSDLRSITRCAIFLQSPQILMCSINQVEMKPSSCTSQAQKVEEYLRYQRKRRSIFLSSTKLGISHIFQNICSLIINNRKSVSFIKTLLYVINFRHSFSWMNHIHTRHLSFDTTVTIFLNQAAPLAMLSELKTLSRCIWKVVSLALINSEHVETVLKRHISVKVCSISVRCCTDKLHLD